MSERLLHQLWYKPDLQEKMRSFRDGEDFMAIALDENLHISIYAPDNEPSHSLIYTSDRSGEKQDGPIAFDDLFSLYHVATKLRPDSPLTHQIELRVLKELKKIKLDLNKQLDSANILESQIEFSHGQEVGRPHS